MSNGFIAGREGTWKHGTNSFPLVLTDFSVEGSAKIMSLSFDLDGEEVDMTVWKTGFRSFLQSFKNGMIEAVYLLDATTFIQFGQLYRDGTFINWEHGPLGDDTGDPKMTGSMFLKKIGMPENVGEGLKLNCSFRIDGPVAFDLFS